MTALRVLLPALLAMLLLAPAPAQAQVWRDRDVPMRVVANLDIERYLGLWYEVARFPNRFERGCVGVTAEYGRLPDGRISVRNICREERLDGPVRSIEGTARVEGPGRLSVNFVAWLPFARGPYWVLHVDPDYGMAVVGAPSGRTGWVLSRTPAMSNDRWARARAVLTANGYDIARLEIVPQAPVR